MIYEFDLLKRVQNWSLTTKMVITLVFLSVITLLITTFIISQVTETEVKVEVRNQLVALAGTQSEQIGQILATKIDILRANIQSDPIILETLQTQNAAYDTTDPDVIEAQLLELDAIWREEGDQSDFVGSILNNPISDKLSALVQQFPENAEVFITDRYGAEVATSNLTSDYYQADEEWWQAGWNNGTGAISFSSPALDESTGVIAIEITVPIYAPESGEVIGVAKAVYDIDSIIEQINSFRFENTGRSQLIDGAGLYIAQSNIDSVGQPVLETWLLDGEIYSGQGYQTDLIAPDTGQAVIMSYAPVTSNGIYPEIDRLNWTVIVTQDVDEALSPVYQLQTIAGLITLMVAGISMLLALGISRALTRPLQQLTQMALQLRDGDYTVRTELTQQDEIGQLASTFNTMAQQLATTIDQLEVKVDEVNEANKQLKIAVVQSREAARLKSEFLATMSHELRTPLNAITGFTGIILFDEDEMDEDNVHMLRRIEANATRLLSLIDDVLDLSKIEAGRVEIVDEPINISDLVDAWVNETAVLAENKNLPLQCEVPDTFPELIYGDSSRLTQIVKNLLSNAIKFTDNGHVKLSVKTLDNQWVIDVEDTGIGIPPHAQNYIFDEFRQVDGSSKRVYGGTGLGLAITRNLVLMMNGTISVKSELGKGSTFTVRLPLRVSDIPVAITAH